MAGEDVSPHDHYRPLDGEEVYRVVGVSTGTVTLLRLTEGGRRRATGEVVTVDRSDLDSAYEPASNPDRGFRPGRWLRNLVSGTVWELRMVTGL